jgi:ABC-type molybdate transport system substrate-binding protein
VDVRMKQGESKVHVQGAPITYGLTIPNKAPHPTDATQLVAFLVSEPGRRIFEGRGFRPVAPPQCKPCERIPKELETSIAH